MAEASPVTAAESWQESPDRWNRALGPRFADRHRITLDEDGAVRATRFVDLD